VDFTYFLFGLRVLSNLAIPRLAPIPATDHFPHVTVHLGQSPVTSGEFPGESEELMYTSSEAVESGAPALCVWKIAKGAALHLAYFDGVQFWLDRAGENIWAVWPEASTLENAATYLIGPILGLVLRLRGITCLHASAVAVNNRAVAFVGCEGAGKSTTAAAMAQRGFAAMADDVVTLVEREGAFHVMPAYPYLCLWHDSAEKIAGSGEALPLLSPDWGKRCLTLGTREAQFEEGALPLGAIYVLDRNSFAEEFAVELASPQDALMTLVANTFATNLLDSEMRANEFATLGRLVSVLPVRKLHVPRDAFRLDELCHSIFEDLQGLTQSRAYRQMA
jgi:hypothetical protein